MTTTATTDDLAHLVASHPFLQGLTPAQVETLTRCAMLCRFSAGEVVFRQGDPANRFYCLLEGAVELRSRNHGSKCIVLQTIGGGDVLGWSWLFPPYQWAFDAVAVAPTRAIFFYGTRLREQLDEDPVLGCEMMRRMAKVMMDRLQAARRQITG